MAEFVAGAAFMFIAGIVCIMLYGSPVEKKNNRKE